MSKKFILTNMFKQVISLVGTSDKGEILFDKRIEFNGGRHYPTYEAGAYHTDNPEEIKALEAHPWFGKEFILDPNFAENFEKPSKAAKKEAKPAEPVAVEAAAIEIVEPVAEVTAQEEVAAPTAATSLKSIEDITTNQQAFAFLNAIDQSLQKSKIRTKETILAKAEEMGYSFPNL